VGGPDRLAAHKGKKVGGPRPARPNSFRRLWGWGAPVRRKLPKKIGVPLHFFGSNSKISHFGERFCDSQYGLVNFLFAVILLMVPPVVSLL